MGETLFRDVRAVSSVVGATLLVALAVVLATTTAMFVLGAGNTTDSAAPNVDFSYRYSQVGNGDLVLVHESGDTLDPATVRVETAGGQFHPAPGNDSSPSGTAVSEYGLDSAAGGSDWVGGDIQSGAEFGIVGGSPGSLETMTVRVVWEDPTGGRTAVLGEWQGPDA